MKFTVLGGTGFIGSRLVQEMHAGNLEYWAPSRLDADLSGRELGHVIYAVGLTSDFRSRPRETVEAHVCHLNGLLNSARFESLLYLSSTRVYSRCDKAAEDNSIQVDSSDPSDLYNLSKLMGESICLSVDNPAIRVVRLSNVFGKRRSPDDFLSSIIHDATSIGTVVIRTGLDSEKDYVSLDAVTRVLPTIATMGRHRLYNVASGQNTSVRALVGRLRELTGCKIVADDSAPPVAFPTIDVRRITEEFDFASARVLDRMVELVEAA